MQTHSGTLDVIWYTRRDGVVRGPFAAEQVTRYILLGRIRMDDELSSDQVSWMLTRSVASLLPGEILHLQGWQDYQQLVEARMRVDERSRERRSAQCGNYRRERRAPGDRRRGDERLLLEFYPRGDERPRAGRQAPCHHRRVLLLTLLLASLMFVWLVPVAR